MKDYQKRFLSAFEDSLHPVIVEFGKNLTKYSAENDVLLIMARKATCLAEALRLLNFCSFQCVITSQRVLDFNTDWLVGKSVAIIDDAVITGTTIYKVKKQLELLGCRVRVYALCVNEDWQSEDLAKPNPPYLSLSDSRTSSFCAEIVDAISLVPIPYATDFPVYTGLKLSPDDIERLLAGGRWTVTDVSTMTQVKNGIFSRVFEPTESMQRLLTKDLSGVHNLGHLIKVRLYGQPLTDGGYWCTFLPIFALEPLNKSQLTRLFNSLVRKVPDKGVSWFFPCDRSNIDVEDQENHRFKAMLRVIQFASSERLARNWLTSMKEIGVSIRGCKRSLNCANFLFPTTVLLNLDKICKSEEPLFLGCEETTEILEVPHGIDYTATIPKDDEVSGWHILERLNKPFLYLFSKYEKKARRAAKKHGSKVFEDPKLKIQHAELMNRLERGFSLYEIMHWLDYPQYSQLPRKKIISAFLDTAIDRGIVVPTTCVINDVVCRAYRHGEDVLFSKNEEKLIANLIYGFSLGAERENLSGKEVEKCTVIALKKGLETGVFTPANKNMLGSRKVLSVKFSLHGAVASTNSDTRWGISKGYSIREILCDSNYLALHGNVRGRSERKAYEITPHLRNSVKKTVGTKASSPEKMNKLGKLLGPLRANSGTKNSKLGLTEK